MLVQLINFSKHRCFLASRPFNVVNYYFFWGEIWSGSDEQIVFFLELNSVKRIKSRRSINEIVRDIRQQQRFHLDIITSIITNSLGTK